MELRLNVYGKNGNVLKSYTSNDFTLKFGICEDVMKLVDIDKLVNGKLNEREMGLEVVKVVAKSFSSFKPFLMDIFEGLTEDECRNTSIDDVAKVIIGIIKYTINKLYSIGGDSSKN